MALRTTGASSVSTWPHLAVNDVLTVGLVTVLETLESVFRVLRTTNEFEGTFLLQRSRPCAVGR